MNKQENLILWWTLYELSLRLTAIQWSGRQLILSNYYRANTLNLYADEQHVDFLAKNKVILGIMN